MISEQQQDAAALYVLGALRGDEATAFEAALCADAALREWVSRLQQTTETLARSLPPLTPPPELRGRILQEVTAGEASPSARRSTTSIPAAYFVAAADASGWKALPIPGAFIKLLSADAERGIAIVLGRLDPGVRYPAHDHPSAEDLLILTGDLTVNGRRMGPGDFHHSDAGTSHPVNYSEEGCTLLAVLSLDHELSQLAMR